MSRAARVPLRAVLAAGAALALACARSEPEGETAAAPQAHEFELPDLAGKTVRLSDFSGKVVLLDFWATYCIPCHESIPEFQSLYERYGPKDFTVLGVSVDAYVREVPDYAKEMGMRYPVLLDSDRTAAEAYGVHKLPTTFLLDRAGRIRREWQGYDAAIAGEIRAELAAVLAGKDAS